MIDKKNEHHIAIRKKNGRKGNACLTDSIQPITGVDDDTDFLANKVVESSSKATERVLTLLL